jgi:hypothetical protein
LAKSATRFGFTPQENAMGRGLLVAAFDFSTAHADEFHDWYDLEHMPERKAIPGFGACERWIGDEQPAVSVATYDLESVDVLRGKAYASIAYGNLSVWSKRVTAMCRRLLRFEGTQIGPGDAPAPEGAEALLLNAMNVAPEAEDDFNAWYDEQHLPALSGVPGALAARRYRSTSACSGEVEAGSPTRTCANMPGTGTHRYVAIYHLESPDVARSTAWNAAVDTPWTARARPHFRDRVRILTRRYVRGAV